MVVIRHLITQESLGHETRYTFLHTTQSQTRRTEKQIEENHFDPAHWTVSRRCYIAFFAVKLQILTSLSRRAQAEISSINNKPASQGFLTARYATSSAKRSRADVTHQTPGNSERLSG
ncbi:hypothetical protein CIHG_00567 [Coccidioides immitis H538.4]|uniref:Uncharacterized protein n=3 Tax=Coccidioides immitis TaxID=5501 RepID=A0A0J8QHM3_COCIT|nr:hypothetical protein CIRG_07378 [Coccidioides immitis RMSCC 2394]KMU71849.1 hypothetical protein CISG_00159 [Coccidioides immitis RMSCC 3703]KMU82784.1 hypothetical protein CIHG_00567 [Coccidioides immitis H538.4]